MKGAENHNTIFAVIISSALQLHKLRLPKKFVRDHGKCLPNFAYIRKPNEKDWPIEIVKSKSDGKVWLQRGWDHFAEHCSIECGFVLIFRYDLRKRFRVLIHDTASLESDRSHNNLHQSGKGAPMSNSRAPKVVEKDATKKANAFLGDKEGFTIRISKSHINLSPSVHVPSYHSEKYLKVNDNDEVNAIVIHGKGKKKWNVKYINVRKYPKLTNGWKKFSTDNGLKEGDVCAFEMINEARKIYNVSIFR